SFCVIISHYSIIAQERIPRKAEVALKRGIRESLSYAVKQQVFHCWVNSNAGFSSAFIAF
ncbi:MAG: hypothetical protein WAV44_01765, partial [Fusicatenibacter saccharivorans]